MTIAMILKQKGAEVTSVRPEHTVAQAVGVLAQHGIGAVLVRDAADQVLGILSERDVVRALDRHGAATLTMSAAQLMTSNLKTATPATTIPEAMAMMTAGHFRHLPVLDGTRLAGMISIGDVVKARLMQQAHEVDSLMAYVAGSV